MIPIRAKILSFIQKVFVLFLACLMIIFVVPVWIFPDYDAPSAEGDFVRLSASSAVYADKGFEGSEAIPVGNGSSIYLKYSLLRFSKISTDEIKEVRLRLSFLAGSGGLRNNIAVGVTDTDDKSTSDKSAALSYAIRPVFDILHPDTVRGDSLAELDVTEYAKSVLSAGKTDIIFMIYSTDSIPVLMASSSNEDPAYRPYLKVVTGMANDTDAPSLSKVSLSDCAFVSQGQPDKRGISLGSGEVVTVGGGNEIYMKFKLNRDAISGTLYRARLYLSKNSGKGKIKICTVDNNEWSSELISYASRPQGSQSLPAEYTVSNNGELLLDISQQICDAAAASDIITLKITGVENSEINIQSASSQFAPKLYLNTSAHAEIGCAESAALSALGNNTPAYVMKNLTETYQDGSGKTAKLRWEEYDLNGKNINNAHISSNGSITRPKWFEGGVSVVASAAIKCDSYSIKRSYSITIPAEAPPDYTKYSFGNYIDIGNTQSEDSQRFESVNISPPKKRRVSGRQFSYRSPEDGGVMVLNFVCNPDLQNYLTLKFRCEDEAAGKIFIAESNNPENLTELTAPEFKNSQSKRFVYATYALPQEFTDGKKQVSLCLSFSSDERLNNQADIYAAYLTQSPYFEPKQFSKQGETVITEPYLGANAAMEFVNTLLAFSVSGISDLIFPEQNSAAPQNGTTESKPVYSLGENAVLFEGEEANIAFSFNKEQGYADIYQRTTYYDRYCAHCPITSDGGLTAADFGSYKLIINRSESETKNIPVNQLEFSGVYKDIVSGKYYSFSEGLQRTDDSAVPESVSVLDGNDLKANPNQVILLSRISEPVQGSDWRVSTINGKSVSELTYTSPQKIDSISVKSVGDFPSDTDSIEVIFSVFRDGKLVKMYTSTVSVIESIPVYNIDTSGFDLYLDKTAELRIFITDNHSPANEIKPKLELP